MRFTLQHKTIRIILALIAGLWGTGPIGAAMAKTNTSSVITGCANPVTSPDYSEGFDEADFDFSGLQLEDGDFVNGDMILDTQSRRLDPSNIEIPVDQEVAVTFLFEGAGYQKNKFGWMYETDVYTTGSKKGEPDTSKIRWPYKANSDYSGSDNYINDDNGNGILDLHKGTNTNRWGDRNNDTNTDARDNRELLRGDPDIDGHSDVITFKAGDKLVFVMDSSENGGAGGVFYSKTAWNEPWTTCSGKDGLSRIIDLWWKGNQSNSTYSINKAEGNRKCYDYESDCTLENPTCQRQGWLTQTALDRMKELYGYEFNAPDDPSDPQGYNQQLLKLEYGEPAVHAVLGAPDNAPEAWLIAFDDQTAYNSTNTDMDYNDLVFLIERRSGGVAQLKFDKVIQPSDSDAFYTKLTFEVYDYIPCSGDTQIIYSVSVNYERDEDGNFVLDDDGNKIPLWREITDTDWTHVYNFTDTSSLDLGPILQDGQPNPSGTDIVDDWRPGDPMMAYTKRVAEIDLAGTNSVGRDLLWKAELVSETESCVPKIMDVKIQGDVAKNALFSRAAPIIQTNVVYSTSYETPASNAYGDFTAWLKNPELRGHLKAVRIYDPAVPTSTTGNADDAVIWDAGKVLSDRNLSSSPRTLYFPDMTVTRVATETLVASADGSTITFEGDLAHSNVLDGTLKIRAFTDREEVFEDLYADDTLRNSAVGSSGEINRFTGHYRVTFGKEPKTGDPVTATYSYYTVSAGAVQSFDTSNSNLTDDALNLAEESLTKNELVNWVKGYKKGSTSERTWPLAPIDHSAPAVMVPPGIPFWFYGDAVPETQKDAFWKETGSTTGTYRDTHKDRQVVVFVGSRNGMLHAFDGGEFSWEDNDLTDFKENRGFFEWTLSGTGSEKANYGTGNELWAYIPGNLVAKLKNNYNSGGGDKAMAWVDASPAISDVYIDGQWRTVLLFAQGDGGHIVTCLDVTDPTSPELLWEFGDAELFNSKSSPAIGQVLGTNDAAKWVAFFVSGDTKSSDHPSIYPVDIATGTLINNYSKIVLDSAGADGLGGISSGQPAVVDSDMDGFVDRLYVGTDKGYMYKVVIENEITMSDYVMNANERSADQPIQASPAVVVDEDGVRVFFGTGGEASTTYKFYAYVDSSAGVSLDWSYELPAGHKVFTSAFAAAGQIYFGTTTAVTEDPCEAGGTTEGKIFAFDQKLADGSTTPNKIAEIPLADGSGRVSPVVDDQHLYIKTTTGSLMSYGSGNYNNETINAGGDALPKAFVRSWREIFDIDE